MTSLFFDRWFPRQRRVASRLRPRSAPTGRRRIGALGVESLEGRAMLSGCPPQATPSLMLNHALDGTVALATVGPTGNTPAQIRAAYGFDSVAFAGAAADGSGTTIAIVDAFDNPNITADLHQFNLRFGLPDPVFTKVNQTGGTTMPVANAGWASEIALDVEWAHAIAPGASILLVEARSNSMADLVAAVNYARNQPGVVAVSMSWGGGEFSGETTYDATFTTPAGHAGVSFFASSGDTGAPVGYPAASPNVVSVGGTSLTTSLGSYTAESGWSGSGGGLSLYESQPSWQSGTVTQSATRRGTPDVAYDADPATGFAVYDSFNNGSATPWTQIGGTSAGAPQWAALAAIVDQGRALAGGAPLDGRSQLLPALYSLAAADFHDITTGSSRGIPAYAATTGYDLVTGRGTPVANLLVADLVAWGTTTTVTVTAPAAPTLFTGTAASSSQVTLTWGAAAGADGYRLYRVSGTTSTLVGSYAPTTASVTVTGLAAATNYTFRLDAFNAAGVASATAQVTTLAAAALAPPTNLVVTITSRTSVQLSWTGSAGATAYTILRSDGLQTSQLGSVSARTTSVRISGLKPGTTNAFAVQAVNASSSATSVWTTITMPASVPPAAVQGLGFQFLSASIGLLTWTPSDTATLYRVEVVDAVSGARSEALCQGDVTSITARGLRSGRTYLFRVVATNDSGAVASDWLTVVAGSRV